MTIPSSKPLPQDFENWLQAASLNEGSVASVAAQAMLKKYGGKRLSNKREQELLKQGALR